jgi:hypothetical protein
MKQRLMYSSTLILFAAASAFAEQAIKAQIPFPFHMGGSIMPEGSYTVDSTVARGVLRFRSADGTSSAMTLSNEVQSVAIPTQPKLVFNRYKDQYFLSQVWAGGSNTGHELLKSHLEKEVAAAAKRTTAILQATK